MNDPRVTSLDPLTLLGAALLAAAVALASALSPLLTLIAFGAILLAFFVLTQPQTVLMIMLAALPWEGLLDFPTPTVTVVKILGFLLVASVTLNAIGEGTRLRAPPAAVAAFALVLFAAVSLIFSPDAAAGVPKLLRYALFAGFFFIAIQLLNEPARLRTALRVLIASVAASALWGLVSFLSGQTALARGPISEPLEFGYLLATMLPLCVYLILEDRKLRWLWVACFPAILGATLATFSRGAFVGIVVMLIWALLTERIRVRGLLVSAFSLIALVAVGFQLWGPVVNDTISKKETVASNNSQARLTLWKGAIGMAMDNPIVGVGTGRYGDESVNYVLDNPIVLPNPQTHNAYLEILAESGPFALAAFLAFLGLSWQTLGRERRFSRERGDPNVERLSTALQSSLVVAIVGAFFLSEQVASPFWIIAAFAAVVPLTLGSSAAASRSSAGRLLPSAT